ncbi:MAG: hypothetical protein SF162_16435 [bacterium]|nr:hypothetical protein [bacterium]
MNRRYGELLVGLTLLVLGFYALLSSPAFAGIVITMGLILFAMQYGKSVNQQMTSTRSQRNPRTTRLETPEERRARAPRVPAAPKPSRAAANDQDDGVYRHAVDAARRAGIDPEHTYVLSTDIGVMVFEDDRPPVIQRTSALDDRADYLQPFVQLNLPTDAEGRVKFEMVDERGVRRFVHEEHYRLNEGANLIMPAARLRVTGQDSSARWTLRIYAENTLVAEHVIVWEIGTSGVVRRHLMEDGELSPELAAEMRTMMAQQRLDSMSLDDLLSHQDDDPPAQAARR